jgi:hypothetical protein
MPKMAVLGERLLPRPVRCQPDRPPRGEIRGVADAAPGRPPSPGNISRDPNAELKGLTVSSAEEWKPGQDTQAVATARLQEQDPDKIHCPAWGVVGNMGDSICYAGVPAKVEAIQA